MAWTSLPLTAGVDIQSYPAFLNQFWKAVQERAWAIGSTAWPRTAFQWASGNVDSIVKNADGSYTVTDSHAAYAVNRWVNYVNAGAPWLPQYYDLVVDDPYDETQIIRGTISANTATTITFTGPVVGQDALADYYTSNYFTTALSGLSNRKYYIIKKGGEWWSDRWLMWPNDSEAWVGLNLTGGAQVALTSLTSSGTTATATATAHGFVAGNTVQISGAISTNGRYNGTFTVVSATTNTFTYTMAGSDSTPATGTPVAFAPYNGANDPAAKYPAGKFATGYELMVKGSDGLLHRITLTGNDGTNLYFARQAFAVAGQYAIIKAGQKWRFYNTDANPYAGPPYRWYDSAWDTYTSHYPDDSLQVTKVPKTSFTLYSGAPACTTPYTVPVFDVDYWTDSADPCNTADNNLTPGFFRTLHGLQVALEGLCQWFIPTTTSYEGLGAIPTFVPATMFDKAGVNNFRSTTTTVGTNGAGTAGINFSPAITLPTPAQNLITQTGSVTVWFAILDANNVPQSNGTATLTSSSFLTGTYITCASVGAGVYCDEGKTIVLSFGWTRKYPNEFLYMWDKTCFVPQYDTGTFAFEDPPTVSYPGTWATRPKSTKYKEHSPIGITGEYQGYRTFTNGDFVRYSGDNWNDPSLHTTIVGTTLTGSGEIVTGTDTTQIPVSYIDNFFEGKRSPTNQAAINALLSGTATGGSAYRLQNTNTNWWVNGVMRTETGTASGGSATSLSDSVKSGNAFWATATGRWAGFIIEVQIGGNWYKRPIETFDGAYTFTWTEPLPASASGNAYQIREPKYEINRWKGRNLTVTLPNNGGTFTTPILYSDDDTLYFAVQSLAVLKDSSYTIAEITPGGVWQRSGSTWIAPTGIDARGGAKWLADQTCNLSTYNTSYGHVLKGDYITEDVFNELYKVLNILLWVKYTPSWTSRANPATPELNKRTTSGLGAGVGAPDATSAWSGWTDGGGTFHPGAQQGWTLDNVTNSTGMPPPDGIPDGATEDPSGRPSAYANRDNGETCSCYGYMMFRRYAYPTVTLQVNYEQSSTDFYAFAMCGNGGNLATTGCSPWYTFNGQGDGMHYNAWHFVGNVPVTGTATRQGPKVGSTNMPVFIGDPNPCTKSGFVCTCNDPAWPNCSRIDGYDVTNEEAIVKWNVANGFVYQP